MQQMKTYVSENQMYAIQAGFEHLSNNSEIILLYIITITIENITSKEQ